MVWYFNLFQNFPLSVVIHTVKGFDIVSKAEVDVFFVVVVCLFVFLGTVLLFDDPTDVNNFISCSSAFSKSSLNICKFTAHVLLKPGLGNFEHYFATM